MKRWRVHVENYGPLVALFLIVLVFVGWAAFASRHEGQSPGTGPFGDSFGTVNAVAAGVAVVLAAFGLSLQSKELIALSDESADLIREGELENALATITGQILMVDAWWSGQSSNRSIAIGKAILGGEPLGESTVRFATDLIVGIQRQAEFITTVGNTRLQLNIGTPLLEIKKSTPRKLTSAVVHVAWLLVVFVLTLTAILASRRSDVGTALYGDAFNAAVGLFTAMAVVFTLWSVSMQRTQLHASQTHMNDLQKLSQERQAHAYLQALAMARKLVSEMFDCLMDISLKNRKMLQAVKPFNDEYIIAMNKLVKAQDAVNTRLEEARKMVNERISERQESKHGSS